MIEITREELVRRLLPFGEQAGLGRQETEAQVNQGLASLGWQGKAGFSAEEVVVLGERMAELARAAFVPTTDAQREVLKTIVDPAIALMREDILPVVTQGL